MWLIKILLMALFLVFLVQNNNDLVSVWAICTGVCRHGRLMRRLGLRSESRKKQTKCFPRNMKN